MTLILNCLTHDYLLQVSDRRLVTLPDNRIVDDNANKSIYYCGHISFGYTGLAEIDGTKTDHWLLETLPTPPNESKFVTVVKEKADAAFKKIRLPRDLKRHAFVGIGWMRTQMAGPLYSSVVTISNFIDIKGRILKSAANTFNVYGLRLGDKEPVLIIPVGQQMPNTQLKRLYKDIKTCLNRKTGPKEMLRLLVDAMRKIAKHNNTVGENLLAVGMPKSAMGNIGLVTPLRGITDYVNTMNTYLYFPADSAEGKIYGPHIKCGGTTQADNEFDPRDGNFVSKFSMKISKSAEDCFNVGMDLCKKDKYEEAISEFNEAIKLKIDLAEAWTGKGIVLEKLGRHNESLDAYDKAIEIKPNLTWAWISQGVTLGNLNRLEDALGSFNKAIQLDPSNYDAWYKKAFGLGKLKRFEEAIDAFSRVIDLDPNNADAWYGRSCCYSIKGNKASTLDNLSKAIELDNLYKERAKKDQIFKIFWDDEDFKKLLQ